MKTADHLTPIRDGAARMMKIEMGMEPKRDRWIGPMVVIAVAAMALLVVLSWPK